MATYKQDENGPSISIYDLSYAKKNGVPYKDWAKERMKRRQEALKKPSSK